MKILIVEDDCATRESYRQFLISEGFNVTCAEDGEHGYQTALASKFDLIITDHNMPRLTGSEMVARLREADLKTPVIVCTGDLGVKCPSAAAIISKPFDIDSFLTEIRSHVRH